MEGMVGKKLRVKNKRPAPNLLSPIFYQLLFGSDLHFTTKSTKKDTCEFG